MMFCAGRPGRSKFALGGIKGLLAADRADKDRGFLRRAKDANRRVDFADIDQAMGPQLDVIVGFVVEMKGGVVFHAGRHVAPVGGGESFFRRRLEIHDVDRIFGVGDDGVKRVRHHTLRHHTLRQSVGQAACEERAGREIPQELAAVGGGNCHRGHFITAKPPGRAG